MSSLIEAIVLNLPVGKIQALLADHTPEERKEIVNAKDPFGDSPLHLAAARQKEILVHILLDAGADPNVVNDAGSTPLHKAVLGGSELVVNTLLPLSKQVVNKSGLYPIDYCRRNKSLWQKLYAQHKGFHSKMTVDQSFLRHIIGSKQKQVEEVRVNTGAHIIIPKNAQSGPVDIQINAVREVDIELAKAAVAKLVANAQKIHTPPPSKETIVSPIPGVTVATKGAETDYKITKTHSLLVPKDKHARIIGKGRKTLLSIEADSNAKITMPPHDSPSDVIQIKGDEKEIAIAKKLILAIVKNEGGPSVPGGISKKITLNGEFRGLILAREKAPGYTTGGVSLTQYIEGGAKPKPGTKIANTKDKPPREPLKLEKQFGVKIKVTNGPTPDTFDVIIDGTPQNVNDAAIKILGLTAARAERGPRPPRVDKGDRTDAPETRTLDRPSPADYPRPAGRGRTREVKEQYEPPRATKPQDTKVPGISDQKAWPSMGGKS